MTRTMVIGGSGPSLASVDPVRVPAAAPVIRVNNFFLEDRYHLGTRVDCAYFSADPRAVRFYVATLRQVVARGEYDVRTSASHLPAAARHRPPRFAPVVLAPGARALLARIRDADGVSPTSGVMAMLHAHGQGATRLLLAGIDLYDGAKYAFAVPPRLARMLAPHARPAGYDVRLHTRDADLRALAWLREQGVALERVTTAPSALGLPLAVPVTPAEQQRPIAPKPVPYTDDWVGRDGVATVGALALARSVRRLARGSRGAAS